LATRVAWIVYEQDQGYDCLFPHYGYLEDKLRGWTREMYKDWLYNAISLPPDEENRFLTDRYHIGRPQHCHVPPFKP
jgi:hypothetical protein